LLYFYDNSDKLFIFFFYFLI